MHFSNRHDLNRDLNNLSAKVLLLHLFRKKNEFSCVYLVCSQNGYHRVKIH
jgi:hypothetical protein